MTGSLTGRKVAAPSVTSLAVGPFESAAEGPRRCATTSSRSRAYVEVLAGVRGRVRARRSEII